MNKNFWDYPLRRHHRLAPDLRSLSKPLQDAFGIAHFCYFFVDEKGLSACLSSHYEWVEHYLYQNLFLHNPFLKDPKVIPEGVFFTKAIKDPKYRESRKIAASFGVEDSIVITAKAETKLKGFCFGFNSKESNYNLFVNELPILKKFCTDFEKRAARTIQKLEEEPVDVMPFLRKAFFKTEEDFLLKPKDKAKVFAHLKIMPIKLSRREKECLNLYLLGESARTIGNLLELSHRTVESYLENIKIKLGCFNKKELFQKGNELKNLNLL